MVMTNGYEQNENEKEKLLMELDLIQFFFMPKIKER